MPGLNSDYSFIPNWLFQSLRTKFGDPDLVKRENITMIKLHMKPSEDEQVAAFLNVDAHNGVFVIYEKKGNSYQQVYLKEMVVDGVQAEGYPNVIVVTGGGGGTGVWSSYYYVIRYTIKGYKEVWTGIARNTESGPNDYLNENGSISFDQGTSELVYAKLMRAPQLKRTFQIFRYNERKMKYELVKTY